MTERTGPVQAQHRAQGQDAYGRFIRHSQLCAECRAQGVDCPDAAELRQAWRDAQRETA